MLLQLLNNTDSNSNQIRVVLGARSPLEILTVRWLLAAEAASEVLLLLLLLVFARVIRGTVLERLAAKRAGLLVSHRTDQRVLPASVLLVGHTVGLVNVVHGVAPPDCIRDALRRLAVLVLRTLRFRAGHVSAGDRVRREWRIEDVADQWRGRQRPDLVDV